MQEFYESPFNKIRGKYFTLEQFMDEYAKQTGKSNYFDWGDAFNIPMPILNRFALLFKRKLRDKEKKIIACLIRWPDCQYVIATTKAGTYSKHEIAHAYYLMYKQYKKQMNDLIKNVPYLSEFVKLLITTGGYCKEVAKDEIQAYLSTGSMTSNKNDIPGFDERWKTQLPIFKKCFTNFDKDMGIEI
jgi:hypothetical protein